MLVQYFLQPLIGASEVWGTTDDADVIADQESKESDRTNYADTLFTHNGHALVWEKWKLMISCPGACSWL